MAPLLFHILWTAILLGLHQILKRHIQSLHDNPNLVLILIALSFAPYLGMLFPETVPMLPTKIWLPSLDEISSTGSFDTVVSLPTSESNMVDAFQIILGAGCIISLVRFGYSYLKLARIARTAKASARDTSIRVSDSNISPYAFGWPTRAVIFPKELMNATTKEQQALIIRHEQMHLRKKDPEIATALALLSALFWFNPILKRLVMTWHNACEIRADNFALKQATKKMRKAYAEALLSALRTPAGMALQCPPASFSNHNLWSNKMRIETIMKGIAPSRKPKRDKAIIAAFMFGVVGGSVTFASTAHAVGQIILPFRNEMAPIVDGCKTQAYKATFEGKLHKGIDIAAPIGTPIFAPANSRVIAAADVYKNNPKWGKVVVLQSTSGITTLFAHLDSYAVSAGDTVKEGDVVAFVGNTGRSTGPHVHIETYKNEQRANPADIWPSLK